MKLSDLVVSRGRSVPSTRGSRAADAAEASPDFRGESSAGKAGAFITPQSLVSFPVATGVVLGLQKIIAKSLHTKPDSLSALTLILAGVIGLLIFLITLGDKAARPQCAREWVISIFIALINSALLAGAALGVPDLFE